MSIQGSSSVYPVVSSFDQRSLPDVTEADSVYPAPVGSGSWKPEPPAGERPEILGSVDDPTPEYEPAEYIKPPKGDAPPLPSDGELPSYSSLGQRDVQQVELEAAETEGVGAPPPPPSDKKPLSTAEKAMNVFLAAMGVLGSVAIGVGIASGTLIVFGTGVGLLSFSIAAAAILYFRPR